MPMAMVTWEDWGAANLDTVGLSYDTPYHRFYHPVRLAVFNCR